MPDEKETRVGGIADSTIAALKSTPLILSLVIFNVLFMALTGYLAIKTGDRYERIIEAVFKYCPSPAAREQQAR